MTAATFTLDGQEIPFEPGQTVMQAALTAGVFVPHLCYHPEFRPHGSCKLCTMKVNGRPATSCTLPAAPGMEVESNTPEINDKRRMLIQMLLVEGNHFCPSCEKSGNCKLQALGYALGVMTPHFSLFYPDRPVDASHPEMLLDFNRCILCELCIRASAEVDKKNVFALSGRGLKKHLIVNAESGRLADTDFAATDKAAEVCPVGVILRKRRGFAVPIGKRTYDIKPINEQAERFKPVTPATTKEKVR
jgi:[NiFe] hydrogenase diaphorase moiety small subunit